jgi:hypothetical protein
MAQTSIAPGAFRSNIHIPSPMAQQHHPANPTGEDKANGVVKRQPGQFAHQGQCKRRAESGPRRRCPRAGA